MYSTKEKSIFLVFIIWILFMVSTFLYSKMVKDVYPGLVMPAFKGVLLKENRIGTFEYKIHIHFANHDSMIVEPIFIFDQLHGREYIVHNYNYLLTKVSVEDQLHSGLPEDEQVRLQQFKKYCLEKIQVKTDRTDATRLILLRYKRVFDLTQKSTISRTCTHRKVFELRL